MWLIHHGRKGQHWGELNGPPYPLDMTNKEYKKKQSEPEKSLVEKKYPKFAKAREKYLDYVEKHFPTGYKMMEIQARLYRKTLPKMYDLDKRLGMQVVVRKGKPVGMA